MLRITFCIILLFLFISASFSQTQKWYSGKVILMNNDVLEARLSYNNEVEILKVKQDKVLKAFNASQVRQFTFFDKKEKRERIFVSLEYDLYQRGYPVLVFFELLEQGKFLSLYSREETGAQLKGFGDSSIQSYFAGEIDNADMYYFMNEKGEMVKCGRWGTFFLKKELKKTLSKVTSDKKNQVTAFVDKNELNIHKEKDLIEITRYYNQIK